MVTKLKTQATISTFDKEKINLIFFYGEYSQSSLEELVLIETLADEPELSTVIIHTVNTSTVKDIHKKYNVSSVPALIILEKDRAPRIINGRHSKTQYIKTITNAFQAPQPTAGGQKAIKVEVYSTPTCSYCTLLKNYLKENKIPFKEIDISKNVGAADKLVAKTGQTGVPQAFINGVHIMGFDKPKINELLKIKN